MAVKVLLFLAVLLKVTVGQGICNNCWEGPCLPVCCDCGPEDEPITTMMPTDMTSTDSYSTTSSRLISTEPLTTDVMTTETPITGSTDTPIDTTEMISESTEAPPSTSEMMSTESMTTEEPDDGICAYWTSNRADLFGPAGGAPIGVCIARWGGSDPTSESYKYVCNKENGTTTIEYWKWTGNTVCDDDTATLKEPLPFAFDPSSYPDQDIFNCEGDPCPYYIIQDGTAHRDQRCPYDDGVEYLTGENDYATWSHQVILQGCQSFDGTTSQYAKCSKDNGIEVFHFANGYCDGSVAYTTAVFSEGTIECNYGTGRAVWCFDEEDDAPSTTDIDTTMDATDNDTESTEVTDTDPDTTSMTDPSPTDSMDPDDTSATDPAPTNIGGAGDMTSTDSAPTNIGGADDMTSTDDADPIMNDDMSTTNNPQLCGYGGCQSGGDRFGPPGFIGICIVAIMAWNRL